MRIDIKKLREAGFEVALDQKLAENEVLDIFVKAPTRMLPAVEDIVENLGLSSDPWKEYALHNMCKTINNVIIFDIITKENE